jgi:methyl-accepting chemotaxis protein
LEDVLTYTPEQLTISGSDQFVIERKKYAEIFMAVSDWIYTLNGIDDNFIELQDSTEKELLQIGSKLTDYHSNSSQISKMSLETANLLSGEKINNAIDGLQNVLRDFNKYLEHSENELEEYIRTVKNILDIINEVQVPLSGFKKIVKHLRIFGISTKIENSRLTDSDTDFSALAEHVYKLSDLIHSNYSRIIEKSKTICTILHKNFSQLLDLSNVQRHKAQSILQKSQTSLDSLLDKHKVSSSSAKIVLSKSEELYKDIGEIVISMQYHDITRQQMEHVNNVLKDCSVKFIDNFDEIAHEDLDGIKNQLEVIHEVENILGLQKEQLLHSKEELLKAIDGILGNLNDVKKRVNSLAKDVKNLTGIDNNDGDTFFSDIKDGLTSIVMALSDISVHGQELSKIVQELSNNVKEISLFIKDIENIGSEIELIALNAQVKAAHTGKEGAALGVLAEAIQKLAVDAFEITNSTLQMFKSIISQADALEKKIKAETSENEKSKKLESLVIVCENLIGSIQTINENVFLNLERVEDSVHTLSNDIEIVVSNTHLQVKVSCIIDKIESKLTDIISNCKKYVAQSGISIDKIDMKSLEIQYTMSSERQIHESFLMAENDESDQSDQAVELFTETSTESEDDLGDNIELF